MNSIVNSAPVRRRLFNGLSVHIFPEPQFHHTFVSWSVSYGSIHDGALPGRAHFLEHMMFYNPDQRPVKPLFHTLGASTSALTRYDVTTYQMACTGDLKRSLEVFTGMLAAPYFTPMHVEQERSVIHQEPVHVCRPALLASFAAVDSDDVWQQSPHHDGRCRHTG